MAIPLIQNVEKQDINTSIIAIRRQLEQLYNALGVTESTVSSEDISKSTGTPLGTWASFENDYAPNIEWLQGGTTFNPNTYPALAMYLGGNTVPERFDHSRLGEVETIVEAQSYQNYTINSVEYDGFLYVSKNGGGSQSWYVYINGQQINKNYDATSSNWETSITVSVKKGDKVEIKADANRALWLYAQYYKHPLFIKATPTSADSDYEGTLNAIRVYVDNAIRNKRPPLLVVDNNTTWSGSIDIPDDVESIILQTGANSHLIFELPVCCLSTEEKTYFNTDYSNWDNVTQRPQLRATKTKLLKAECQPNQYAVKVFFKYKY